MDSFPDDFNDATVGKKAREKRAEIQAELLRQTRKRVYDAVLKSAETGLEGAIIQDLQALDGDTFKVLKTELCERFPLVKTKAHATEPWQTDADATGDLLWISLK
jgi:hypothetical protein